jgi:thymidine kinase
MAAVGIKKVKPAQNPEMSLEILLGPMFAGKSSAIIRMVNRYKCLNRPICLITHSSDDRYSAESWLVNHDELKIPCEKWSSLMDHISDSDFIKAKLVIIDEAQFFVDLKKFVEYAVDHLGKDVLVVGLDGDADRKPFGQILELIPLADNVQKLKAFCKKCGDGTEAIFSFCNQKKTEQVCIGGSEMYMPLCRKHYLIGMNT